MPAPPPKRCAWPGTDPLYNSYHDKEWGVPLHNDCKLFEFLILEGAQAGLSWITILRKRQNYRAAFDKFDFNKVATYRKPKIESLLKNDGIIRNRLKIESTVTNAKAFLAVRDEFRTFDRYLWEFVDGKPIQNRFQNMAELPASTPLSDKLSKDLKRRGFKFVGGTIAYAFMQAIGMVNDHTTDCYRYKEIKKL